MKYVSHDRVMEFEYKEGGAGGASVIESHCHASFEIIAVLEGDIGIILEGETYRCTSDQIVLIPPLKYHNVSSDQHEEYRRMKILFQRDFIPAAIEADFLRTAAADPIVSHPQLGATLKWLESVLIQGEIQRYAPLMESLLTQILYCCAENQAVVPRRETNITVQKIIRYIEAHIYEKILLDDIASRLYISKSSMCHLFQKKMNISIKQYILQKKMAHAAQLMHDGMGAAEAARRIGYDNYSNFYRMYRNIYHIAPSAELRQDELHPSSR